MLDQLLAWIQENSAFGMIIILVVACLESLAVVGILVPGALFMIAVGGLVATDALNFYQVVFFAVLGAILGDSLSFLVGRHLSDSIHHHRWFVRHQSLMERSHVFVNKHGMASVMLGRFVGPLRAFVPLVVGVLQMPSWKFLVVNVASAIIWAPVYMLPGMMAASATQVDKTALWWALIWCLFMGWLIALIIAEASKKAYLSKRNLQYFAGCIALVVVLFVSHLDAELVQIYQLILEIVMRHWHVS